jgi:hypothetical protein
MGDSSFGSAKRFRDGEVRLVPSVSRIDGKAAKVTQRIWETIPAAVV